MVKKSLMLLVFCLTTTCAAAQTWPVLLSVDSRVLFANPSLNFHGAEMSMKGSRTFAQFSITAEDLYSRFILRYVLATGAKISDEQTPAYSLVVGSTEFGTAPQKSSQGSQGQQGQANQNKPVGLGWSIGTSHRIELALPWFDYEIYPLVIGEWNQFALNAESRDSTQGGQGQKKRDSETQGKFFVAGGFELAYAPSWAMFATMRFAGSDKFLLSDVSVTRWLNSWFSVGAGFEHKQLKFNDSIERISGAYVKAEVVF